VDENGCERFLDCRRRKRVLKIQRFLAPPLIGGLDLNSNNSGCACLGSGVAGARSPDFGQKFPQISGRVAEVYKQNI